MITKNDIDNNNDNDSDSDSDNDITDNNHNNETLLQQLKKRLQLGKAALVYQCIR